LSLKFGIFRPGCSFFPLVPFPPLVSYYCLLHPYPRVRNHLFFFLGRPLPFSGPHVVEGNCRICAPGRPTKFSFFNVVGVITEIGGYLAFFPRRTFSEFSAGRRNARVFASLPCGFRPFFGTHCPLQFFEMFSKRGRVVSTKTFGPFFFPGHSLSSPTPPFHEPLLSFPFN